LQARRHATATWTRHAIGLVSPSTKTINSRHGLLPSCRSLTALLEPPGVRVAAGSVQSASHRERRLQGFALWMGPYHRAPFPASDGLPSRGLLFPSKVLRSRAALARCPRRMAEPLPRIRRHSDPAHSSGQNRRASRSTVRQLERALFRCPPTRFAPANVVGSPPHPVARGVWSGCRHRARED
jgi:hypothetical protein